MYLADGEFIGIGRYSQDKQGNSLLAPKRMMKTN